MCRCFSLSYSDPGINSRSVSESIKQQFNKNKENGRRRFCNFNCGQFFEANHRKGSTFPSHDLFPCNFPQFFLWIPEATMSYAQLFLRKVGDSKSWNEHNLSCRINLYARLCDMASGVVDSWLQSKYLAATLSAQFRRKVRWLMFFLADILHLFVSQRLKEWALWRSGEVEIWSPIILHWLYL